VRNGLCADQKSTIGDVIKTPPPAGRHHGITSTPLPALVTAALSGYWGVPFRADAIHMCRGKERMKTMKLGVLLLAFLLAAMVMVPMVNADDKQLGGHSVISINDNITSNYVSISTAREHAIVAILDFSSKNLINQTWNGATVDPRPQLIYDMNGDILFYQFSAEKDGEKMGDILVSASKVLGVSVQKISDASTYDLKKSEDNARQLAKKNYPGFSIQATKIVAYSYPNMGIMVHLVNKTTNDDLDILFDAYSFQVIPLNNSLSKNESGAFSYYGSIPESSFPDNIAHWNKNDLQISEIKSKAQSSGIDLTTLNSDATIQSMNQIIANSATAVYDYDELPSSFPRIDQGQTEWCQVATAWVITKYWHSDTTRTLQNIASKMQITDTQHSATADNELNYYTSSYLNGATNGGLGKTNSYYGTLGGNYLTYEKVKEQIHQYRAPLKVGRNGHSRACIGYSRNPGGDTYYKFSNSQGGVFEIEAAPYPYGSNTGYNDYIIVQ
jgi:hypothetical protein